MKKTIFRQMMCYLQLKKHLYQLRIENIGGTTSISASNDEGSYTVNFEIKCAAEASGLTAGDVIRYGGVWRQGNEEQQIIGIKRQLDWNDFSAEWEEFSKKKLRLVDLETYVQDGSRKYAGVFHRGNDGYALWVGLNRDDFLAKWEELGKQKLRLILNLIHM